LVEVVAVVVVAVEAGGFEVVPVDAGVSVEVVVVVMVVVVPVDPVSSTTLGCSLAVVVVEVSVVDSSDFLQPPRNRSAVAIAAMRNRARDFFID
jgi:hypothetical protein